MIQILIMDVDGTLTDGKIYMSAQGELFKAFHIKDGCGIHDLLIPAGIVPVIMTGRKSEQLEKRCEELEIQEVYQGVRDKSAMLDQISDIKECPYSSMAYIGDDINDLTCMKKIKEGGGVVGCPLDAAKQVIEIADFVSERRGGEGAVREFIEWILNFEGKIKDFL